MTLEFEKLTDDLKDMAQTTARRHELRRQRLDAVLNTLAQNRTNWTAVSQALALAKEKGDEKQYSPARPYDHEEPLDAAIDPPPPPAAATIIATDGSQIMPDRHAAYLYYLINVGGIIYHHGSSLAPETFSFPKITYPKDDAASDTFDPSNGTISIERDLTEIETLARQTFHHRNDSDLTLAILDQRLLYWPIDGAVTAWGEAMTGIRQSGALLCGYIDRPGTQAVVTLLKSITAVANPTFNWRTLGTKQVNQGLTDRDIFGDLLQPGQRSKVFVNVSPFNEKFAAQDAGNEVCFFYLNPSRSNQQIARVDIPRWVAENPASVSAVHALIIDQCRLLGDYPYVIARADEMAVVGHQDASELNFMIDVIMERHGIRAGLTAKQGSKEIVRGGRTRFES
ncbi:MAG: hypothetical protein CSB13_08900 [Chloroflexi bacterium]|nr:MAG: hypothetical protein CSB13_08900 [Chloroflexota bacterium]